jgi:gamma-glutamyltranspeptidase/glutathione hydrolase
MLKKILQIASIICLLISFHMESIAQVGSAVPYQQGVISSGDEYASEAGLEMLEKGGNAVDAAIAVQFTLAVTLPRAGNIGGGGFLVLYQADGSVTTLDFREKAPGRASRDMYLDDEGNFQSEKSKIGGLASGVPGTVDGMISALERYGTLPLEVIMEPAIRLAEEGYPLRHSHVRSLNASAENLGHFEGSSSIFLREDGREWQAGDLFVQPDLAETLKLIARQGRDGFYSGVTARLLIDEVIRQGGIMTLRDLREYRSVWRDPVRASYHGYELYMMPPPSSGGMVMKQALQMLGEFDPDELIFNSAGYYHRLAEVLRRAFADRNYYLGDPNFVNIPVLRLTDPEYLEERMADFNPTQSTPSDSVSHGNLTVFSPESAQTTNFSVIDSRGNAVAVNTTLNGSFGSFITVTGAGFLMNNEMDDFSAKPGTPNMYGLIGAEANAIEPGKRMLSSMSPTIATKNGRPVFIGGGAGGPRIISATLQDFLNVTVFGMNAAQAISAPRIHHQWIPDRLLGERLNFPPDTREILESWGHEVRIVDSIALTQFIYVDEDGLKYGAADPRGDGSVKGY